MVWEGQTVLDLFHSSDINLSSRILLKHFMVKIKVHRFQFRYPSMKMLLGTSVAQAQTPHCGARPQQCLPSKQLKHHKPEILLECFSRFGPLNFFVILDLGEVL